MKKIALLLGLIAFTLLGVEPKQDSYAYGQITAAEKTKKPYKNGHFELVESFCSCSYYYGSEQIGMVTPYFQKIGDKNWQAGIEAPYFPRQKVYRGSIVNLDEDTEYRFQLRDKNGKVLKSGRFRTWSSEVPVTKTIVLNEENFKGYLEISDQGTPHSWIRYTAEPGFVLTNDKTTALLTLFRAKYVLLDGLVFRGGDRCCLEIINCQDVRVRNCEFSNWGRVGKQDFARRGQYYLEKGGNLNGDGAIRITQSRRAVIERCYAHDPAGFTNAWRYSHPSGTEAVFVDSPRETVLRYNDFIGNEKHRFNDAVEGEHNFFADGGFNRDADIYGNYMVFCNDDCIELDGGQCNVRCFYNRFEDAHSGVSIQGCMTSPSYVFNNVFFPMGDQFQYPYGRMIKTAGHLHGYNSVAYIFCNTLLGSGKNNGSAVCNMLSLKVINNIFAGNTELQDRDNCEVGTEVSDNAFDTKTEFNKEGDLICDPEFVDAPNFMLNLRDSSPLLRKGKFITNFTDTEADIGAYQQKNPKTHNLPYRPIPVELDKARLEFYVKNGKVEPEAIEVTATIGGKNFSEPYSVRKGETLDWFEVTPSRGVLKSGQKVKFTVRPVPEKLGKARLYRGAFLIRLDNGFSRPVSVYVNDPNVISPAKPDMGASFAYFIDPAKPEKPYNYEVISKKENSPFGAIKLARKEPLKKLRYNFEVPKDGNYYIMIRCGLTPRPLERMLIGFDKERPQKAQLVGSREDVIWLVVGRNFSPYRCRCMPNFLKAGKHVMVIYPDKGTDFEIEGIAITDTPLPFEPL